MRVYFIDVGQGDATLISFGGEFMPINAGDNSMSIYVQNYFKINGVEMLKYVIGTHSHADHISRFDVIITKFQVGQVFLPDKSTNTKKRHASAAIVKNQIYSILKGQECIK